MPDDLALTIERGDYGYYVKLRKAYLSMNDVDDYVLSEPDLGAPSPVHFDSRCSAEQARDIFALGFRDGFKAAVKEEGAHA